MTENAPPSPAKLEWENPDGLAEGVGICLSGGGIRAAMFSLGVLQTLQKERGLLFGSNAAKYLSAVSGGSYIASAYVANGAHLAASQADLRTVAAPFSAGSPEEQHLLASGGYLATPWFSQLPRALLGIVAGPVALFSILVWVGFFIADVAVIVLWISLNLGMPSWAEGWPWWLAAPLAAVPLIVLGRSLFAETIGRRMLLALPGIVAALILLPPAMESLFAIESLRTAKGWAVPLLVCVGIVGVCAGAGFIGECVSFPGASLNRFEKSSVLLFILVLIAAGATLFLPLVLRVVKDAATGTDVAWFVFVLFGPLVAALILRRTSLHQFYRESLNNAFGAVRRTPDQAAVPREPTLLSTIRGPSGEIPRLLISATANVRHKSSTGEDRTFTCFVFSDAQCGIPSSAMCFDTRKLELARSDAYFSRGTERLVTLPTSVAATGAAISASMGRYTRPSCRLILALLNVRLGRPLPNAARPARRAQVAALSAPRRIKTRVGFLLGLDDLIAELLGVSGPNMYVSDGGHYDNLGLMALLRARCETIWCIDASPDKWGAAAELSRVATLAKGELDVSIAFDRNAFSTTTRGMFPVTHIHGSINYGEEVTGAIHVIKLGLHACTPAALTDYRGRDRAFPHHSTLWQIYPRRRMEAYRDLGRANSARCLRELP